MTFLRRPRRLTLAVLLALALAAGLSAPAPASPPPRQQDQGEVLAPSGPRTVGPVWAGACGFAAANTLWGAGISPTRVPIAVPRDTRGRPFELVPRTPGDLDMVFVGTAGDTYFETRGPGGESGTVPVDATHAFVCLVAGVKTAFTYTVV